MFRTILVVCTGNICRSPVAVALLRAGLPQAQVASAGLAARVGEDVEPTARAIAEADGLELGEHAARDLSPELLSAHELILVMSERQRRAIGERYPEALGKTMLFGRWLDDSTANGREIPDPYGRSQEVFGLVHELLKEASRSWIERLGDRAAAQS